MVGGSTQRRTLGILGVAIMTTLFSLLVWTSGGASSATPPTTSVLIPTTGATITGTTVFDAAASNTPGVTSSAAGITSVQFELADGTLTNSVVATATPTVYGWLGQWDSTTVANGTYSLTSVVTTPSNGTATSTPVSITVSNTPLATSVLAPEGGSSVKGFALLDAAATSGNGISSVTFDITGGTLSKWVAATATPTLYGWLAQWNSGNIPNGTYSLTSVVTDASHNTATSTPVTVTVANAAPLAVEPWGNLHVQSNVSELPLPPTAPSTTAGSCSLTVNPNDTGCITDVGSPGFYGDPHYVLVGVDFAGAPAVPDRGSIYTGNQILLLKTDGTTFSNGDAWKCITCGIPTANIGAGFAISSYPPAHAFPGDTRVLLGNGVLDCGTYQISDPNCTPANTHIYPIDLGGQPLGGTLGQATSREWRLDPDGVHLGLNMLVENGTTYDEFGVFGRLSWDATTSAYDLINTTTLFNPSSQYLPYTVQAGNQLQWNPVGLVGEFRGFSADGQSVLGIQSFESGSIDAFSTSLETGQSKWLTYHAEYTDPMFASPDGKWMVNEEVLGSGRTDFISGMQGVPPLTDQLPTTGFISGIRNNGNRRFFQPYLVSTSNPLQSERVNLGGDPNWNANADPVWLADSSAVVYEQTMVTAPACGGTNPLPCPVSGEPGGRTTRLMIARFPSLTPTPWAPPAPVSDSVPWGTPYTPGAAFPARPHLPAGTYTLKGISGSASVVITTDPSNALVMSISVTYNNFNFDFIDAINGTESVTRATDSPFGHEVWNENLTSTGVYHSQTKVTSPAGFNLGYQTLLNNFEPTGTMVTTVDGNPYTQPGNGD